MIENFLELNLVSILIELKPDTPPVFGKMSAQHMLEHLTNVMHISNGQHPLTVPDVPEHMFDNLRRFLMGKNEYPIGFSNPMMGDDLPPLRNKDFATAIQELIEAKATYIEYFAKNPDSKPFHPVFGVLTYEQWNKSHSKHFTHHFKQFGIIV